jgi:hypothetical protein
MKSKAAVALPRFQGLRLQNPSNTVFHAFC